MRHRETITGGFTSTALQTYFSKYGNCANPWDPYFTRSANVGTRTIKTIDDAPTPGFGALRKCGKFLPLNSVVIRTETVKREASTGHSQETNGSCDVNKTEGSYWFEADRTVSLPPVDPDLVIQVGNQAIADARAAAFDALTFMAEAGQTVALLAQTYRRFNRLTSVIAREAVRAAKNPRQYHRMFSRLWLEGRFGWLPMVYDAEDLLKAILSQVKPGDIVRGRSRLETTLDLSNVYVTPQAGGTSQKVYTDTLKGTRTYRGKAYAEVTDSSQAKFGFDPLVTTWEKIPYSFVVDYFIDIGTFVQAVTPFSGANLLGAMTSIKDEYELKQLIEPSWPDYPWSGSYSPFVTTQKVTSYSRGPYVVSLPSLSPRLNLSRWVDLVALMFSGRSSTNRILRGH